jgi:hypothetical protein
VALIPSGTRYEILGIAIQQQTSKSVIQDEVRRITRDSVAETDFHKLARSHPDPCQNVKDDPVFIPLRKCSKSSFLKRKSLSAAESVL